MGIWVELRPGDGKAKGEVGDNPVFSATGRKDGAPNGELIAGVLDSGALAA